MKRCTKCGTEYEATLENFSKEGRVKCGLNAQCRNCVRKANRTYAQFCPDRVKTSQQRYAQSERGKEKGREKVKRHYATLYGYFNSLFPNLKTRCSRQESYVRKGIQCKFESAEQLRNYVLEIMQVDPRGKQCHRIDNDGNYEPGNIEFLASKEHGEKHRKTGAVVCRY